MFVFRAGRKNQNKTKQGWFKLQGGEVLSGRPRASRKKQNDKALLEGFLTPKQRHKPSNVRGKE